MIVGKRLKLCLQLTGFYTDSDQTKFQRYLSVFKSVFSLLICCYALLFQYAALIAHPNVWNTYNNTYFLILSWSTQESLAMGFIFYWFQSGRMEKLLKLIYESKSKSVARVLHCTGAWIITIFILLVLLVTEIMLLKKFFGIKTAFLDGDFYSVSKFPGNLQSLFQPWFFEHTHWVSLVLGCYKAYTFHLTFFIYSAASAVLFTEFEELNQQLKQVRHICELFKMSAFQLKQETKLTKNELKNKLHSIFLEHIRLVDKIRQLNQIVQVIS
jgi:hypothetical protein